jgi:pimeloyl-ACP methyl ester carboxylesterase
MHSAPVTDGGAKMRWVELPGGAPARVYIHGLGAMSSAYYGAVAADPRLGRHRSLLMDLLGFGLSDRPVDFGYSLDDHAEALARALRAAAVSDAEIVGHSMGGAVAIGLAAHHPDLVSKLVLVDANLDPYVPSPASHGIATYTESEFLSHGWDEVRDRVSERWWSTMRLAGREALYRSAVHLARATTPTMRQHLMALHVPRTYLYPEGNMPGGADELRAAGVRLVAIARCGHNIMLDNPDGFVEAVALALDDRDRPDRARAGTPDEP